MAEQTPAPTPAPADQAAPAETPAVQEEAAESVSLTHQDYDGQLDVPADEADKYTHGGWSVAEKSN